MTGMECFSPVDGCRNLLVNDVIMAALKEKTANHFWVIDSVPNGPAMKHVRTLMSEEAGCTYGDLSALGYAINHVGIACSARFQVSLVVLGCAAVLSNGEVVAARGSCQVAMVAQFKNVPLLVLAPTYKFVDKVRASSSASSLRFTRVDVVPSSETSVLRPCPPLW